MQIALYTLFCRGYQTVCSDTKNLGAHIAYGCGDLKILSKKLLGRVAGTSSMLMKLALPVGLLIGGIWAETLPIPWIFLLAAVAMLSNFFILKRAKFSEVE